MTFKINKILCLMLIIIFTFLLCNITTNVHSFADSIKPQLSGNKDSYVYNSVKNDGYKDPADVNDPGATVHVSNANEFLEDIGFVAGSGAVTKSANDPVSKIHKIILDKDISLSDATDYPGFSQNYDSLHTKNGDFGTWLQVEHNNMVIDGNGHTLDMLFNDIALNSTLSGDNWTLENMKVMGSSYWGPISTNSPTTLNYRNIDYYGSQLLWSSRVRDVNTNIYGNIGVHSLFTYKPLKGVGYSYSKGTGSSLNSHNGYLCESYGNQQNMQTGNIFFHDNSKYYGESYNANCLELYGSAKLGNNVDVLLQPHGTSGENAPSGYGSAGVYLNNNSGGNNYKSSLDFSKSNSNLIVDCNNEDVHDSDGTTYAPRNPKTLSVAFFADSQTNAYLNKGENNHFDINGLGYISNNNPLVNIKSMNAYVSGKDNSFNINEDSENSYVPNDGVLNTSKSNVNVTNGGTFNLHIKNIPSSNTNNYLIDSTDSVINIFRPKEVKLSNDNWNDNQSNFLNTMGRNQTSTVNYINAKDVKVNAYLYGPNGLYLNNILSKNIILPLYGNRLYVPGIRLIGSYFNMSQYANGLNNTLDSNNTATNFNYVDFKGTPIPKITSINHTNTNTHNRYVSGKVVDDDGNPIKDSYVKLKLDGSKKFVEPEDSVDERTRFYRSNDDFKNYINSKQIIYNLLRNYIPNDLGSQNGNDMVSLTPNFYSSIYGDSINGISFPMIRPELKNNYFGYANPYFYNNINSDPNFQKFNAGATEYDKNGDFLNNDSYVATTDENGNFSFKVPQSVFDDVKNIPYSHLSIVPAYNFTDGKPQKLLVSYNPLININNTIKDLTYPKGNSSDGKTINKVFQGGGYNMQGDTLEFNNTISNKADNSDVFNATYTQPIPSSMDDSTLQLSYDNGKTFNKLNSNDYDEKQNEDGTKNINIKRINIFSGKNINLILRGTMKSPGSVNNNPITLKPYLSYNDGSSFDGDEMHINFTDNSFTFQPHDIDFGIARIEKNNLLSTENYGNPLVTNVKSNIRDNTPVNILVQQDKNKFYDDNGNSFIGDLLYDGNDLLNPTEIFNTDNESNLYLKNNHPLYLLPKQNVSVGGEYKTKLTWSVNYGIH